MEPIPLHCSVMDQTMTTFPGLQRDRKSELSIKRLKKQENIFGTISQSRQSGKVSVEVMDILRLLCIFYFVQSQVV